jgi:hypothetical protein
MPLSEAQKRAQLKYRARVGQKSYYNDDIKEKQKRYRELHAERYKETYNLRRNYLYHDNMARSFQRLFSEY